MAIQGLRTTTNFVTDQRPLNWREAITILYPNGMMPLTAFLSLIKSESTDDPDFNWWEKALPSQRFTLGAALTAIATTITLAEADAWKQFRDGHLVWVEGSDELLLVNGNPTSNVIDVSRGQAGTVAAAVDPAVAGTNPKVLIVGNMMEENSKAPIGINYDPSKKHNFTQIFRNTLEITRTASKTRLRTPAAVKEAKRECLELHGIELEKAFWLGGQGETTKNGKPARTTKGLIRFIDPANIVDLAGAATDMDDLEGFFERMFRFGSSEKVGFCGNTALLTMNRIVRKNSTFNIQSGIKEYGMNVTRYTCPFGELVLKTHPLWNQNTGGDNGGTPYFGMNSWLVVLDQQKIRYRYFTGDDMRYQKKLEDNDLDGMKSGYITECGLEVQNPETHFMIKGLATAAKDA